MTDSVSPRSPILKAALAAPRIAGQPFAKKEARHGTAQPARKAKKPKKAKGSDTPGPDGTVHVLREIRTGTQAVANHRVRCRPGSFEWRYGRRPNVQYHAGAEFARTWEQAGIASALSVRFDASGGGGGAARGLADARTLAFDRIGRISAEIGRPTIRRLVSYCVEGRTPKEIAASYRPQIDVTDRQISDTLDLELHELAKAMGYAVEKT